MKKQFEYAFRIDNDTIFNVDYIRLGENEKPHFSTSGSVYKKNRLDIECGGQCQEKILKNSKVAKEFYEKWDKKHLQDLTQKEYNKLVKDLKEMKKEYKYICEKHSENYRQFSREGISSEDEIELLDGEATLAERLNIDIKIEFDRFGRLKWDKKGEERIIYECTIKNKDNGKQMTIEYMTNGYGVEPTENDILYCLSVDYSEEPIEDWCEELGITNIRQAKALEKEIRDIERVFGKNKIKILKGE